MVQQRQQTQPCLNQETRSQIAESTADIGEVLGVSFDDCVLVSAVSSLDDIALLATDGVLEANHAPQSKHHAHVHRKANTSLLLQRDLIECFLRDINALVG